MIFNSVTYLVYLLLVVGLYWVLPRRPRLWLLFGASLVFYGFWRFDFVALMLVSAVTDYYASLRLDETDDPKARKLWVLLSLVINLGLLGYFKYLMFFADSGWELLTALGVIVPKRTFEIVLPLGISFYTFQTISYTIDVYRKQLKPVRDFALYGTYVTFFPQLVAGPVLRASEVVEQLDERPAYTSDDIVAGIKRIVAGLFLKVVLADNIAEFVDAGYAMQVASLSALDVWTLAFLFGFQIYFDFSAYSHIAIGSARLMGISFPENFNFPYAAVSPRDFWGRWHISLSSWIRDYLYLPLAGAKFRATSQGGLAIPEQSNAQEGGDVPLRRNRALFLTWAIMGLWHGAAWRFMVWGLFHALCVFGYRQLASARGGLPMGLRKWGGFAITLPLMMIAWVPFRAQNVGTSLRMWQRVLTPSAYTYLGMRESTYLVAAMLTVAVGMAYWAQHRAIPWLRKRKWAWVATEGAALSLALALVFVFLRPLTQFIYFQF